MPKSLFHSASLAIAAMAMAATLPARAWADPAAETPDAPADLAPASVTPAFGTVAPTLPDGQPGAQTTPAEDFRLGVDSADRMTVAVEIGGVGPYSFIIDTGSQRSIVATELAQRLALPVLPPVQIVSMAGRQTVAAVQLNQIKLGSHVVNDLPALSVAQVNIGEAGLIGLDGLQDKRLLLDFKQRKMEVSQSRPAPLAQTDSDVIVVQARSKLGQLILVGAKLDGRRVSVILDTGAEMSVGNMALYNNLKQKRLVIPPRPTTITSITGDQVQAQFTIVRRLEIASVVMENVPMVFLDAAPFDELGLSDRPAMLLGMGMLRMFNRVAIDFGNRHVDFELPKGTRAPDNSWGRGDFFATR